MRCWTCHEGFCEAHEPKDKHPCLQCHHGSSETAKCSSRSVAMCPSCSKAYCAAHLKTHTVWTNTIAFRTERCNVGRVFNEREFFSSDQPCCACGQTVNTGRCTRCHQFVCALHRAAHVLNTPITTHAQRQCHGYTTAIEKLTLLGKLPAFTFQAFALKLPNPKEVIEGEAVQGGFPPLQVATLGDTEARALLTNRELAMLLEELEKFDERLGDLSAAEQVAVLKATGCLGPLYSAFLGCTPMKTQLATVHQGHLQTVHARYRELKDLVRMGLPPRQGGVASLEKSWTKKMFKLSTSASAPDLSQEAPPAQVFVLDMQESSWFAAMTRMRVLRKSINALYQRTRRPLWHLTVLHFGSHWVFAVNQKNATGGGTTRIVWPLTSSEKMVALDDHVLRDHQIRVLDLSYPEVDWLVTEVLSPELGGDAACAQRMLDVVEGKDSVLSKLDQVELKLGSLRCALLRGMRVKGGVLQVDSRWRLTRKSRSKKNLDDLGVRVSASAALCNVLCILFIAEPRHAQSMYASTLMQLAEVAEGRMSFKHLFGRLGNRINHGRLLPGANVLGPPLLHTAAAVTDFSNSQRYGAVHQHVNRMAPTATAVKVERKRLAMPLADAPLHPFEDGVDYSHDYRKALQSAQVAALPEYEPLMKVLFTILLRQTSRVVPPKWTTKLPPFMEIESDLKTLAAAEEAAHDEHLEDEAEVD